MLESVPGSFHSESRNYELTVFLGSLVLIQSEHEPPVDDKTVAQLVRVDLGGRSRGNATKDSVEEMGVQKQKRSSR